MLDKIFSTTKYNVKTLKNLSTKITSGATPLSGGDAYTDQSSGIPFVRSGNINPDNEIDFNSLLYVKPEIHNKKLKSSQLILQTKKPISAKIWPLLDLKKK